MSKRAWLGMARATRSTADYLRYRAPEYRDAAALHERAARESVARRAGVFAVSGCAHASRVDVRREPTAFNRARDPARSSHRSD